MDPTDLRAELAERLAGREPIDAETLNAACFMLSRALDQLTLSVPEAAPLARWIDEALRALGYQVGPTADGGREELKRASEDWG
jgi:hypothetical protein